MPWPEFGTWSNKTAAELRPVIVALCNAVGDRYECIGMNRPSWPVNLDQSESTLDIGTKSAALVEADLYRLDLFRYGWWGMIANGISALVNRGSATFPSGTTTQCGGWSKTGTGAGHGSDLWTIEDLETHVGLGTLSYSVIGGPMHLFDEVAPNRLRQMLDELIYPVIFPKNRRDYPALEAEGWTEAATLEVAGEAAMHYGNSTLLPNPKDGDDAWGYMPESDDLFAHAYRGWLFAQLVPDTAFNVIIGRRKTVGHCVLCFDQCQNETGVLGEILAQYLVIQKSSITESLDGADFEVLGATRTLSGSNLDQYEEINDAEFFSSITGKLSVGIALGNFANNPDSPFTYALDSLGYTDIGSVFASLKFGADTEGNHSTRSECTRFILDITAHLSDQ